MIEGINLAAAPISWGVCEVPGWGEMLDAERVLREMSNLGLTATELGPVGYLGYEPSAIKHLVGEFGLTVLGGFVPLVLHDAAQWAATEVEARDVAARYAATGATKFVTAVVVDNDWSEPMKLSDDQWEHLIWALARIDEICAEFGMVQVLHPHVGTLIETASDINRVLADSSVKWCLDTGHLTIGGVNVVDFAKTYGDRVGIVHLKDVRMEFAPAILNRSLSLLDAARRGIFCSLGDGDVPIAAVIKELDRQGYDGWYVLEQDMTIDTPADAERPVKAVARSLAYLERELVNAGSN